MENVIEHLLRLLPGPLVVEAQPRHTLAVAPLHGEAAFDYAPHRLVPHLTPWLAVLARNHPGVSAKVDELAEPVKAKGWRPPTQHRVVPIDERIVEAKRARFGLPQHKHGTLPRTNVLQRRRVRGRVTGSGEARVAGGLGAGWRLRGHALFRGDGRREPNATWRRRRTGTGCGERPVRCGGDPTLKRGTTGCGAPPGDGATRAAESSKP
mmetsp:Transcript_23671/g.63657  ORF Transcript_23671/g.63657 Transcript_23671/m.63657 type:complete len:209 (+) Transcript_23671:1671-2297(+)